MTTSTIMSIPAAASTAWQLLLDDTTALARPASLTACR